MLSPGAGARMSQGRSALPPSTVTTFRWSALGFEDEGPAKRERVRPKRKKYGGIERGQRRKIVEAKLEDRATQSRSSEKFGWTDPGGGFSWGWMEER